MNQIEKYEMLRAMKIYNGGFVNALAQCFEVADENNTERLIKAFPEYVKQYTEMAKHLEAE